jgi:site-specific recombinase XerD
MTRGAVDKVLRTFLAGLPSPTKDADSRYTPHSFRAAVINALFEAGVGIEEVADLVGHSNVNTTKGYQRKRRAMTDSASHKLPY